MVIYLCIDLPIVALILNLSHSSMINKKYFIQLDKTPTWKFLKNEIVYDQAGVRMSLQLLLEKTIDKDPLENYPEDYDRDPSHLIDVAYQFAIRNRTYKYVSLLFNCCYNIMSINNDYAGQVLSKIKTTISAINKNVSSRLIVPMKDLQDYKNKLFQCTVSNLPNPISSEVFDSSVCELYISIQNSKLDICAIFENDSNGEELLEWLKSFVKLVLVEYK
ncbi:uncharacterized protein LOC126899781 [Daktulosphaira vitifoliae]|uniref:uncharacterized protein LOC126899781 n=1 Tax=Daktulosphaira vitifoliae TaxID=58002 RepID=UPI0021AAC624|nr:uncharacterized protein LOC126899781 [Daktulosphaira vitifoliae]